MKTHSLHPSRASNVIQGRFFEARAARYLEEQGLRILERNVWFRVGEIDLVAEDPVLRELVFVEVRARYSPSGLETPLQSLGYGKFHRLRKAIALYLSRRSREELSRFAGIRIDLLGWDGSAWQWMLDLRSDRDPR